MEQVLREAVRCETGILLVRLNWGERFVSPRWRIIHNFISPKVNGRDWSGSRGLSLFFYFLVNLYSTCIARREQ